MNMQENEHSACLVKLIYRVFRCKLSQKPQDIGTNKKKNFSLYMAQVEKGIAIEFC